MGVGKYFKEKLIAIHKWNQKRWLIIPLITSTIGVWFSLILTYLGINLHLLTVINNTRILTWQGWVFTGLVVLVSTIFVIAQRVYEFEELNNGKDKAELVLLNVMNSASNELCDIKYATLKEQIKDIKSGLNEAPQILSNPKEQLKHIIKCLNESLCTILSYPDYKINGKEMYICLHYNFPDENNREWYLAESLYAEKSISKKELLGNNSTFNKILKSKEDLLFCNSKEDARKQDSYVPDSEDHYDENNNLKGSIGCYKIQIIHQNKPYINAIISFVTYSKKFVNTDDKKHIDTLKYNVKENILSIYKKRISIELCLLYISKLREIQQQQVNNEKPTA
ncbi:hypothetical protein [Peribacillus frigoritolerans]|uniref:hypothetical protein n=1 Tax=Peribacillus frigoritolerans TaxID=450367 RepID=UPI0007BF9540|nr:hypothetical protein [Peribacillus frigoritolerans]